MDWDKSDSDFRIPLRGVIRDLFLEDLGLYTDVLRRYLGRRFWPGKEHRPPRIFFISTLTFSGSRAALDEDPIFKRLAFSLKACIFQREFTGCQII